MKPLLEADAPRRPVDREYRADEVLPWNRAPAARVARRGAVVAEHQILALRDRLARNRLRVSPIGLDVRLVQLLAVDVDEAVLLAPGLAWQPDEALDEGLATTPVLFTAVAGHLRGVRRLEDHDLASLRIAEVVDEAVREH